MSNTLKTYPVFCAFLACAFLNICAIAQMLNFQMLTMSLLFCVLGLWLSLALAGYMSGVSMALPRSIDRNESLLIFGAIILSLLYAIAVPSIILLAARQAHITLPIHPFFFVGALLLGLVLNMLMRKMAPKLAKKSIAAGIRLKEEKERHFCSLLLSWLGNSSDDAGKEGIDALILHVKADLPIEDVKLLTRHIEELYMFCGNTHRLPPEFLLKAVAFIHAMQVKAGIPPSAINVAIKKTAPSP